MPPMSSSPNASNTRLRQIALVAQDLEKARHLLTCVLGTEVVYIEPEVAQWGLKNFLGMYPAVGFDPLSAADANNAVAIGGELIEVVSPFKPGTTAGRQLSKRGDGGYMIIMQTRDAIARRSFIESKNLAKVIYCLEYNDAICIQYHPKGIKGGVIPELDSHRQSARNPDPLGATFSPWHACGPNYVSYSAGMRRCSHLQLVEAVCRLAYGDTDTELAARQWEETFGVPRIQSELTFTNGRLKFTPGEEGKLEGLVSITIAVKGEENFNGILDRAKIQGVYRDGWIDMIGLKWYIVRSSRESSRL